MSASSLPLSFSLSVYQSMRQINDINNNEKESTALKYIYLLGVSLPSAQTAK